MRRVIAITAVLAAAAWLAVAGTGAGDGGGYEVRAIFDSASFAIPGEDVRVAGVTIGKISDVEVTEDKKAAITLDITDAGFQDFRSDARCIIRPQSLIGEKFVECTLTDPRAPGQPPAPALPEIASGPDKGQHLVPVTQTVTPVDIDLISNIWRRPYAERFSILLGEFGTALAGRGADLGEAIKRSNPALQQTDEVLSILAKQNKILANLARDSDIVLAPLARERARVADFIVQANTTASATAEESAALQENFAKLPEFLRQLQPTMVRLGALARTATPVFTDLNRAAPDINTMIEELGPFSAAGLPAVQSLGDVSVNQVQPALEALSPVITDLASFTKNGVGVSKDLNSLTASLQKTGGTRRLLDFLFYTATAVNGFDQFGHYLRADLIANLCSDYNTAPVPSCSANFGESSSHAASTSDPLNDPSLSDTSKVLRGADPQAVLDASANAQAKPDTPEQRQADAKLRLPSVTLPGTVGGAAPAPSAAPKRKGRTQATKDPDPAAGVVDYLLGTDK
jgi:ABC-type transporter Mla subunit MlaD